jgi:TonB family protein
MTHFVDKGAVEKVMPQYPPAAQAKGLGGTVRVRLLIDKQGLVERTCPVYVRHGKRPDRSLVVAAEAAALHWKFKPNFGIEPAGGVRFDYVYDVILFQFDPATQNTAQAPDR